MPLSPYTIREKTFREMKKDVGMTTAQKSKETNGINLCSVYPANNPYIYVGVASDYSAVMYVYVGIVGWIYRTKIDPISILLVPLLF